MRSKHRTSFALDDATVDHLRRLAGRWRVSQAEVVRRAVKLAAEQAVAEGETVLERLRAYQAEGRVDRDDADEFLRWVAQGRVSRRRGT